MSRRRIQYGVSEIEKRYPRDVLLVDDSSLSRRLSVIESVTAEQSTLPTTRFSWDGATLVLRQERVRPTGRPSVGSVAANTALEELAVVLDQISERVVHGDIAMKNLLYDGRSLRLVDWEPALRQRRQGRETLLYTEPYLSINDRMNDRLSAETDKIGFYHVARRLLVGQTDWGGVTGLIMARTRGEGRITPIPEAQFVRLHFREILAKVVQLSTGDSR